MPGRLLPGERPTPRGLSCGLAPHNGGNRGADNSTYNQQRVAEVEQSGLHEEPPFPRITLDRVLLLQS